MPAEQEDPITTTFTDLFNRYKGDPETVDGRKVYVVRCKVGEARMRLPFHRAGGKGATGEQRAIATSEPTDGKLMIEGTASSTSEDWYGTEMSPACLLGMQAQFNMGIGLFPSHGSWIDGLEWDDEMGHTVEAVIEPMQMTAGQAEDQDPEMGSGYCLRIKGDLDAENAKCQELARRLAKGQKIGMSIGGWFTEIRFIMDEDEEEIDRIIVEKVELDHLAIVRNPANPDCVDLKLLRSIATTSLRGRKAPPARSAPMAAARSEEPAAAEPTPEATPEVAPETPSTDPAATQDPGNQDPAPEAAPATEPEVLSEPAAEPTAEPESPNSETPDIAADRGSGEITTTTERPMPTEAETRALELERQLTELRAQNLNLQARASQAERRGQIAQMANHRRVDATGMEGLLTRAEKELPNGEGLIGIIRSRKDGLSLVGRAKLVGKQGEEFRSFCNEAPDFLREILDEAHETGAADIWRRELAA